MALIRIAHCCGAARVPRRRGCWCFERLSCHCWSVSASSDGAASAPSAEVRVTGGMFPQCPSKWGAWAWRILPVSMSTPPGGSHERCSENRHDVLRERLLVRIGL